MTYAPTDPVSVLTAWPAPCENPIFPFARASGNSPVPVSDNAAKSARSLCTELWSRATDAFGDLGDAAPAITEAEAFVRPYAHDCVAAHHEKDYRVLQLLGNHCMRSPLRKNLEADVVGGKGAVTRLGFCYYPPIRHMRALQQSSEDVQALLDELSAAGRVVRDLTASGWESGLEAGLHQKELRSSRPHPCYRCRQPQPPCKAGERVEDLEWDPADPVSFPLLASAITGVSTLVGAGGRRDCAIKALR